MSKKLTMKTVEHMIEMHRLLITFHVWGSISKGNFKIKQQVSRKYYACFSKFVLFAKNPGGFDFTIFGH